jgi:hypothetical protein
MDADFKTVEGDDGHLYVETLTDEDTGEPIDLTGTDVTFRMHIREETAAAIEAAATIGTPETDAVVSVAPVGPAGTYNAEFVIDDAGVERTWPRDRTLLVVIRPRV